MDAAHASAIADAHELELDPDVLETLERIGIGFGAFVNGDVGDAVQAFDEIDADDLDQLVDELREHADTGVNQEISADVDVEVHPDDQARGGDAP